MKAVSQEWTTPSWKTLFVSLCMSALCRTACPERPVERNLSWKDLMWKSMAHLAQQPAKLRCACPLAHRTADICSESQLSIAGCGDLEGSAVKEKRAGKGVCAQHFMFASFRSIDQVLHVLAASLHL